jgi:enoyl-CoA hydratase
VNGFALGSGLELAMACQNRIASDNIKWVCQIISKIIPGYEVTTFASANWEGTCMEMIMTAGMVGSDDAFRVGLVNHVVPPSRTEFFVTELQRKS